jgi:hypothetical protein
MSIFSQKKTAMKKSQNLEKLNLDKFSKEELEKMNVVIGGLMEDELAKKTKHTTVVWTEPQPGCLHEDSKTTTTTRYDDE